MSGHIGSTMIVATKGPGFYRLGQGLQTKLNEVKALNGLLNVFCTHTSASLCIQENADPTVLMDLGDTLRRLAPEDGSYQHDSEGPDDMPAHIKTLLTQTSLALPVRGGTLALGVWQEPYLIEHRAHTHRRRLELDFIGSFRG